MTGRRKDPASTAVTTPGSRSGRGQNPIIGLLRRPAVLASLAWLALVVIASAAASFLAPQDPLTQDIAHALAGPSTAHWLGTDELGRDLFSRLLHGGGYLLLIGLVPVGVSFLLGVPGGLLAGFVGGWMDVLTGFLVNVIQALPGIVVVLAIAAATNNNLLIMCVVIGVLGSAGILRLVRASTQATRNLLYVDAARVAGLPRWRILSRHILPNILGPLVVQGFLLYGGSFMFLTALSFLSLGFSPEAPSWGQLTYSASQQISTDPWMMVPIGVSLVLTVHVLNTLGAALLTTLPSAQRGSLLAGQGSAPRRGEVRPVPTAEAAEPAQTEAAHPGHRGREIDQAHAEPPEDALLALDRVSVSFPAVRGGLPLVEDVSFHVRRGRTLGLVGESGSGKSLTALAVLGLVPAPGEISSGKVFFDGDDLLQKSEKELSRIRGARIGLVSQEPMVALDPCFTVESQLMEPLRAHRRLSRRQAREQCRELLRLVGIVKPDQVARSYPHQLSGGMAQRVAIALALSGEPDLLVADEPTTALDVTVQAEILDLLRHLQSTLGMTLLLVTHDLGVVADICDDVAVMYAGQIVETGSVDDVLLKPTHPYTRALLNAAPELSAPGQDVRTIPGSVPLPSAWTTSCRFASRCPQAISACEQAPIALLARIPGYQTRCIRAELVDGSQR